MKLLYGEHSYEDGSIYYGQWNSEGKKHGIGKYTLSDGKSIYVGEFNQGSCEGLGVLTTPNFVMQGQFKENRLNGVGRCVRCDGLRYEGEFRNGEMKGLGLLTFPDGNHGIPTCEGLFDGFKLIAKRNALEVVKKAVEVANIASKIKV